MESADAGKQFLLPCYYSNKFLDCPYDKQTKGHYVFMLSFCLSYLDLKINIFYLEVKAQGHCEGHCEFISSLVDFVEISTLTLSHSIILRFFLFCFFLL